MSKVCFISECGLKDTIVLVRHLVNVEKNEDVAELEKAKIILHQKERVSTSNPLDISSLVDSAETNCPYDIWMHRTPEPKQICQIQREKLNKDLPMLLTEIGSLSGTEGWIDECIRMVIRNLEVDKY